jgi:hypothetical protein
MEPATTSRFVARDVLDEVLALQLLGEHVQTKLSHNLGNREVADADDLERALGELRARVMVELAAGHRARLV